LDAIAPFLDPQEPVTEECAQTASKKLRISIEEIRESYERLAGKYDLKLTWLD